MSAKLSIIVPAYNEENTIQSILIKINEVKLIQDLTKEIIVVNDCSKDNTEEAIQEYITNNPELKIKYFKQFNQNHS